MDILAGIAAYIAGFAVFFGALAMAFFVFFAAPQGQPRSEPQSANAMLLRSNTLSKTAKAEARVKQAAKERAGHSEKKTTTTAAPAGHQQQTASREVHQKPASSAAHARRPMQDDRAPRWAYRQDEGFDHRFLGYAD